MHFERAGLRAQAYRAALAGARAASAVSSRREAFELYGRAVANMPDDLGPDELAALYEGYCEAALAIDDVPVIEETAHARRRHFLDAGRPLDAANMLVVLRRARGATSVPRPSVARCSPRRRRSCGAARVARAATWSCPTCAMMQGMLELDAGRHAAA